MDLREGGGGSQLSTNPIFSTSSALLFGRLSVIAVDSTSEVVVEVYRVCSSGSILPHPRMHHRTSNRLLWMGFGRGKQDKSNSEHTRMCRLLCLNSWFPFLDLEQDDKEMLSQKLKSWEAGSRNRVGLRQQQMC